MSLLQNVLLSGFIVILAVGCGGKRTTKPEQGEVAPSSQPNPALDLSKSVPTKAVDLDDTITPKCKSFSNAVSDEQIKAINPMFAERGHRLWHVFFHGLRSAWAGFTPGQKDILKKIHPSLETIRPLNLTDSTNGASEDFIYMHRIMIRMVREILVAAKLPCIGSFTNVPTPKDATWPVPPLWNGSDSVTALAKSSSGYATMLLIETSQLHNDEWLKEQTAAEVSFQLEGLMHLFLHHRFSSDPKVAKRPLLSIKSAPGKQYDDPSYNYLIDTYSATLSKAFWKLHGYIEDVSLRWIALQGYSTVSVNCNGRAGCYQWNKTWQGPSPHAITSGGGKDILSLATQYAKENPADALAVDAMLKIIDLRSAPGFQ